MTHVPYKALAPATVALISGEVHVLLAPPCDAAAHRKRQDSRGRVGECKARIVDVGGADDGGSGLQGFTLVGRLAGLVRAGEDTLQRSWRNSTRSRESLNIGGAAPLMQSGGYVPDTRTPAEFRALVLADYNGSASSRSSEHQGRMNHRRTNGNTDDSSTGARFSSQHRRRHGERSRRPSIFENASSTAKRHALSDLRSSRPFVPANFYCAGLNYQAHLDCANSRKGTNASRPPKPTLVTAAEGDHRDERDRRHPADSQGPLQYEAISSRSSVKKPKNLTEITAVVRASRL